MIRKINQPLIIIQNNTVINRIEKKKRERLEKTRKFLRDDMGRNIRIG